MILRHLGAKTGFDHDSYVFGQARKRPPGVRLLVTISQAIPRNERPGSRKAAIFARSTTTFRFGENAIGENTGPDGRGAVNANHRLT
jgi:hypothetical protein